MKRGVMIAIVVVALALIGIALYLGAGNRQPLGTNENGKDANSVEIVGFAFSPAIIEVKIGDTVTWTNKDSAPHTVTSESGSELDSPTLAQGESFSHTFESAGEYDYLCRIHPMMKGKVVVTE